MQRPLTIITFIMVIVIPELKAMPPNVQEVRTSVRSLIAPLLPGAKKKFSGGAKDFRVDQCQREKINWTDVLLMRKTITLTFKFKEGCDAEGTISPKVFSPFPAEFRLRHLKNYNHVSSQNKVGATFESQPTMSIEMRQGVLTGDKGKVKFEADYQVVLDPLNQERPIKKNLGGELRITEVDGKKVSIKEKILVE